MDVLTQGLLGAAVAQSGSKPDTVRQATFVGAVAGLLADADTLIRSGTDPLLVLEVHRHFSHALVFIPMGALLAAGLCALMLRGKLPFAQIYRYALLGYALSGVLDACTSYGTHLLWPFSETRIAWSIIAIVDPLFTGLLLVGVLSTYRAQQQRWSRWALVGCLLYLGVGVLQQQRAKAAMYTEAASRGHTVEAYQVKPTLGNLILWRATYRSGGWFYADAIRVGLGNTRIYPGESLPQLVLETTFPTLECSTTLYRDMQRFAHLSDGFIAFAPNDSTIISDVRYALTPRSMAPLWGIAIDRNKPDIHVDYRTFRTVDPAQRQAFIDMLLDR